MGRCTLKAFSLLQNFCNNFELSAGTGLNQAWLKEGLHPKGNLVTVKKHKKLLQGAHSFFEEVDRIEFLNLDASEWIENNKEARFNLIFTDTWAGKFTDLEAVLEMVKPNHFLFNRKLKLPSPFHWSGYYK
jgi:predicted O-methyltransferase YrrM